MITIVDYNAGNLRSVKRACDAVGVQAEFADNAAALLRAKKVIFPGVGAARSAMDLLNRTGMADALRKLVQSGVPLLGICLGAQLILERSEEGDVECLALLPGRVRRFRPQDPSLKVPHMGWNAVQAVREHPLLAALRPGDEFYFVHSYYPDPASEQVIHGVADYDGRFCCALGQGNLFATQFHPEKSGPIGLEILKRFAAWDGASC
jgi:imidazole glycerol-phosphate synthase subunit HisH